MIEELRNKAKDLLKTKKVDVIIGYARAADGVSAKPCFIDTSTSLSVNGERSRTIEREEDTGNLIWDAYCVYNLSGYIKDFPDKKIAIVAKACDVKSIVVLLQENQARRQNLFIIGVECPGIIDEKRLRAAGKLAGGINLAGKCRTCKLSLPELCDYSIKDKERAQKTAETDKDEYESIRKLEAKSLEERAKLWQEEFSRCIRCYACRQICPMCYCPKCVAEQTQPSWFSKATNAEGNLSWNVTRAMHLAGRCIDCGECERACPMGIPLRDINKKIEKDIKELFNYEAGLKIDEKPLLSCFDKGDPEDFIK